MRRNYGSFRKSGAYTSPGTPEHCEENAAGEVPKAWSSERVALPTGRPISAAALMPFNSGKPLPSKWDDAERWITSPVAIKIQPQRRPKSKSGPLGPTGIVYLPNYSPAMGGNVRNFTANSPLTTGVLVPDGLSVHYEARIGRRSKFSLDESNINRSISVPGLSDLIYETSTPNSPGDRMDDPAKEGGEVPVFCRDVATQMSPDETSARSSSMGRLSFSNLPSAGIPPALCGDPVEKDEVRDVQVDKGATGSRSKKRSTNVEDVTTSGWNISEASRNTVSKLQREEAKITAWENLQKAKADAAIRKLEMKLEKKRSASMDKISHKLRAAQMKAQAMRESLSKQAQIHPRKKFTCCMHVVRKIFLFHGFFCDKRSCLK